MSLLPPKQSVSSGDLNYSPSGDAVYSAISTSVGSLASKTLNNLTSPTAINTDLLFGLDGIKDIGASGASRPNNIYVKTNINLDSLTVSSFVGSDASKNLISLTATTATSYLNTFQVGLKGLVPAPTIGDASNYLRGDGTWASVSGGANTALSNLVAPTAINVQLRNINGSVSAPSYSFTNNTNTGLYADASSLYIVSGGQQMFQMTSGDIYCSKNFRFDGQIFGMGGKPVVIGGWGFSGNGQFVPNVDATGHSDRYYSIGRSGDVQNLQRPYRIDVGRKLTVGKKFGSSLFSVYGATLAATQTDDITTSYTTTANNSTTITTSSGDGIQSLIDIGDYIQLNGLSTTARVTNFTFSYPVATLTVDQPLGDGTSRTIIVKQSVASFRTNDGVEHVEIDRLGVLNVRNIYSGKFGDGSYIACDAGGEARLGFLKISGTGPCLAAYGDMVFKTTSSHLNVNLGTTKTELMRLTSNGVLRINSSSSIGISNIEKLEVNGNVKIVADTTASPTNYGGLNIMGDGIIGAYVTLTKDKNAWVPSYAMGFQIPGGSVTSDLIFSDYDGSWRERLRIAYSELTINNPGNIYNFRIKGDNDSNLFFTDGTNDKVGIGTSTPAEKLEIIGNTKISNGDLIIATVGNGLKGKTGLNSCFGIVTGLSNSTKYTVNTNKVVNSGGILSMIFVQPYSNSTKVAFVVDNLQDGASFDVLFDPSGFTGDFAWMIVNQS